MLRKWLNSDVAMLVRRVVILYVVLFLCRVVFYLYNIDAVGAVEWGEIPALLRGSLVFDTVSIIYFNALFIVLSLLPTAVRGRRWYRIMLATYYFVANTIVVAVNMADAVYFKYTLKRFTADEIFFADNDNTTQLIGKFAAENWYMVLFAVLCIALLVWGYGVTRVPKSPVKNKRVRVAVQSAVLVGAIALMIGGVRGGFTRETRPITLSNATAYSPSPDKANLILSNPFCIVRTMGKPSIKFTEYFNQQELASIYTPYHYPKAGAPSLGKRNIVIFILESFSSEHSALLNPDLYPDGKGYTPFLDSLMREGYTFGSAFSNGRKSIDALPSILASIPSFKTPFVLMPQSLGEGRQLPKILAEEGYATSFFNGSARGSMGFGAYVSAAGVQQQFSREDYEKRHSTNDFDGYWGIWDEPFLGFMGEELNLMPQPFFSAVFTLSSHHPFVVPEKYLSTLDQGKTKMHRPVAYTDISVRHFFDRFSGEEWFPNTIFVFVGDHVSSETFAPKTKTPTGNSHIISFIYTPDGAIRGRDDRPTQQIDIMPTLLGLIGYDKPYFAFGRDVIGEGERRAMAVNYMNQSFQAITDSMVLFYDENRTLSAFSRCDTLQKVNLASPENAEQIRIERDLKALIQQYYTHVKAKSYVVR